MQQDKHPVNCLTMKVDFLVMFAWWKYHPIDVTLADLADKTMLMCQESYKMLQ